MKIYISVDIEGVAGVVDQAQASPPGIDYTRGRRLMTQEAAAAVRGALAAGASEVWVSDGHGGNGMRNIIIEDLPPDCWLISGDTRPMGQVEGLDGSFAAVAMVGYHTRHGVTGVLNHTINGRAVYDLSLNGRPAGEAELGAAVAGHLGVPVVFVSGDDRLIREVAKTLPWAEGVAVKEAIGRHASKAMHPERACRAIEEGMARALARMGQARPFDVGKPVAADLTFKYTTMADSAARLPGAVRTSDLAIRLQAPDAVAASPLIRTAIQLAGFSMAAPMKLGEGGAPGT